MQTKLSLDKSASTRQAEAINTSAPDGLRQGTKVRTVVQFASLGYALWCISSVFDVRMVCVPITCGVPQVWVRDVGTHAAWEIGELRSKDGQQAQVSSSSIWSIGGMLLKVSTAGLLCLLVAA
jgi:hypothetical protein